MEATTIRIVFVVVPGDVGIFYLLATYPAPMPFTITARHLFVQPQVRSYHRTPK